MLGIELLSSASSPSSRPRSTCWRPRSGCRPPGLTEENLQARARGLLLMALSNKFGWMLLTTGNKSEVATGTPRSTATWPAASPSSRTYRRRWYTSWRAGATSSRRTGDPAEQPRQAALGGAATRPEGPGFAAALPGARRILEKYVEQDWSVREIVAAGYDEALVRRVLPWSMRTSTSGGRPRPA
jgi:hypothetical protein